MSGGIRQSTNTGEYQPAVVRCGVRANPGADGADADEELQEDEEGDGEDDGGDGDGHDEAEVLAFVAKRAACLHSARGVGQSFQRIEGERWLISKDPCRRASVGCG